MNPRELASYPFLREAAEFVRARGPSLSELLDDIAYSAVRGAGVERVRTALERGSIPPPACREDWECLEEMLSYICARLVVSVSGSQALVRRYCLTEAKRAWELLREEPPERLVQISGELGLPVEGPAGALRMHFALFLRYGAQFRAREWKLINRRVDRGMVELEREELCRLLEEAVRRRFEAELPLEVPEDVKRVFGEQARALRNEAEERLRRFQPRELGKVRITAFPPCMRHLLGMAQSGENVPHSGRFALVTFLHSLGVSSEEIMKAFAASPDFQEEKTRYQVEHITGVTSGTEYSPPGCDTMKTYGLCFEPDGLCARDWMTHPMKYYRAKTRARKGAGQQGSKAAGQQGRRAAGEQGSRAAREQGGGDEGKGVGGRE